MEFIANMISSISGYMYSYVLIVLLIAAGIYFSFRTKFVQIRMLKESIKVISEPKKDKDSISSFQALMVSTASRVGTGNIVGVTGAIIAGGPGAVCQVQRGMLESSAAESRAGVRVCGRRQPGDADRTA